MSIQDYLKSSDPLSEEAMDFLLAYKQENKLVDFKVTFDNDSKKEWLEITKDAMAFANTCGGYLVFGVEDATFKLLGLTETVAKILANVTLIHDKLNRFISPHITSLQTKEYRKDGKTFIIFWIPESKGKTHIVIKEGKFSYPGNKLKTITVLWPGMIPMRISGSNHVIRPEDFEFIVNRRIEYYKEVLFDRIARVADAPIEDSIIIVSTEAGEGTKKEFIVSDAPDAIPIKGMSFSVPPRTDEEEIEGFIALANRDPNTKPPPKKLWRFYSRRHELSLHASQRYAMAKFCLLSGVPAFFWAKEFTAAEFKDVLVEALVSTVSDYEVKATCVNTGAFLGKGVKSFLIKRLGKKSTRLSSHTRSKGTSDPREFFHPRLVEPMTEESKASQSYHRNFLEKEATELAIELSGNDNDAMKKTRAVAIDCCLYARNDKYRPSKKS